LIFIVISSSSRAHEEFSPVGQRIETVAALT